MNCGRNCDGTAVRDGAAALVRGGRTAFPDIRTTIENALKDGDRIAVRCEVIASHTGPGTTGTPTDQTASFTGICIARVKDGRIAEGWNNFDFLSLYQQLGMQLS